MKYALDTEFIDTPTCSVLISIALVREDGAYRYFEVDYPKEELTDWLRANVLPHLSGEHFTMQEIARSFERFIGNDKPEFWCYFGAYDWYWFCRLFGGLMNLPNGWPHRYREFAEKGTPEAPAVAEHHALEDARMLMEAIRRFT